MSNNRITTGQRYEIHALLREGKSYSYIAGALNVHRTTIWREVRRNCDRRNKVYRPDLAERKARERMGARRRRRVFTDGIKADVIGMLSQDLSPEQISGRLRREGRPSVSHETIYRFVWADKAAKGGLRLYEHLRRRGRRRRKRGSPYGGRGIPDRRDISLRQEVVDRRARFGDLEIDTVIGKSHRMALLTINDRASGVLWIRLLSGKEAAPLAERAIEALTPFKHLIHTITADNGREFALHGRIEDSLGVEFYFARPYHSWERGANEILNGLVRQYFPKGSSLENVTPEMVAEVQRRLNNRPRLRLGFETPAEAFFRLTGYEFDSVALLS